MERVSRPRLTLDPRCDTDSTSGMAPTYEIKVLDLMDIDVQRAFLVLARQLGSVVRAKTWSYLILGGDDPVLVDTGASSPEIMGRLGMTGYVEEWQGLDAQLELHGLQRDDIRWILHTHHHIDHAGQDDRFPNATVITNRRELEFSASGIMGAQYPPEYVKHHIDRLHTPGAMRLLDLELSGPVEVLPGIVCESAGGAHRGLDEHPGPDERGIACMCGDIVYDLQNAVSTRIHVSLDREPQTTGNHALTKRQEKAAIKKALNCGTFFLTGTTTRPASSTAASSLVSSRGAFPAPRFRSSIDSRARRTSPGTATRSGCRPSACSSTGPHRSACGLDSPD